MNCCTPLALAIMVATLGPSHGQIIDDSSYPNLFGDPGNVTVDPITGSPGITSLLSVVLDTDVQASGALGDYWNATATGGAEGYLLGIQTVSSSAQVALTGTALEFNVFNDGGSLLGSLGTGVGLELAWSATATFDEPGSQLLLAPNSTYQVEFNLNGNDGLLSSVAGLLPSFGIELLDGSGAAVDAVGGGSLVDILGLELLNVIGSPPGTQRAIVQFQTGTSVAAGPGGIRFTGSAFVPATALGIGDRFASVSDLSVTPVPEPSSLALGLIGAAFCIRRRR